MDCVIAIIDILLMVLGALYAARGLFFALGLFSTRKFDDAKKKHSYAIVVAARNEERVIGNLLDSIAAQDYPRELVRCFVVADNCTDNTAVVAREHGAICYERTDAQHKTKGYALQFLFRKIAADYGIDAFEAYFVFDADNLLSRDYISRMNDAFDIGEKVVTSYRNTKNMDCGCISASYALHWLRTARMESRGRSLLRVSTRLQGTGFLISSELLSDGWNYVTLAEDRELTSWLVSKGYRITYQHLAQFYDEQPMSLDIAFRQRMRWAKGHLEAFVHYTRSCIKGMFNQKGMARRFSCYDIITFNFPSAIPSVALNLVKCICLVLLCVYGAEGVFVPSTLLSLSRVLFTEHLSTAALGLVLFFTEKKRMSRIPIHRMLLYSLTFPLFSIIGDIATFIALFKKVEWTPIPHTSDIRIEKIEELARK